MSKTQSRLGVTIPTTCPCCDQVWLAFDPYGSDSILTMNYEGFDATVTSHVWQVSTLPNVWLPVQTGGVTLDINSLSLINDILCSDKIRVEYTDPQGCIHYSNISFFFCP